MKTTRILILAAALAAGASPALRAAPTPNQTPVRRVIVDYAPPPALPHWWSVRLFFRFWP